MFLLCVQDTLTGQERPALHPQGIRQQQDTLEALKDDMDLCQADVNQVRWACGSQSQRVLHRWTSVVGWVHDVKGRAPATLLLCGGRVPVEPVLTTTAACSTVVESSLGSAGLLQWSQTQVYTSNAYYINLSQAV